MHQITFAIRPVLLLALCLWMGGCSLYVNIPQQPGDVALNNPNLKDVGYVEEQSLRYLLADGRYEGPVQIILPDGTYPKVYERMVAKLGGNVTWTGQEPDPNMVTLQVKRVMIRTPHAEVDVLRPASVGSGVNQLVTVTLRYANFGGWNVVGIRVWKIDPTTDTGL